MRISISTMCRNERRRAQGEFDRERIRLAEDRPDKAEEPSDDVPVERSYEDDGLDTEPVL